MKYLARQESLQTDGVSYIVLLEADSFRERIKTVSDLEAMKLATKVVVTVDATDKAEHAFRVLSERKIKKAPVVQDGKLVGTLSRHNIMKALKILERSSEVE